VSSGERKGQRVQEVTCGRELQGDSQMHDRRMVQCPSYVKGATLYGAARGYWATRLGELDKKNTTLVSLDNVIKGKWQWRRVGFVVAGRAPSKTYAGGSRPQLGNKGKCCSTDLCVQVGFLLSDGDDGG
jgi:hypothetical protein